jgi:hypothetical protein
MGWGRLGTQVLRAAVCARCLWLLGAQVLQEVRSDCVSPAAARLHNIQQMILWSPPVSAQLLFIMSSYI